MIDLAQRHGTDAGIVKAWIANSRHRRDWAAETVRAPCARQGQRPPARRVGVGLQGEHQLGEELPILATLAQLPELRMRLHDPAVPAAQARHPRAEPAADPLTAATAPTRSRF